MADINVTPLVDVMLVLLIIFMVTAPMLTAGVPVNLPDSKAKPLDHPEKPLEVTIDAHGAIYVDKDAVPESALPLTLAKAVAGAHGQPPAVQLNADTALDYGRVMRVMSDLNRAGLNRVALVTASGEGR